MAQKKRILILEDEKPMAKALELKLNHAGFDTISAGDGEAGLTLLGKDKFHCVLLDLVI